MRDSESSRVWPNQGLFSHSTLFLRSDFSFITPLLAAFSPNIRRFINLMG